MKRALASLVVVLVSILALAGVAPAAVKEYPQVKLSINFPDAWKIMDAKNGVTMVGAPGDDAGMLAWPMIAPPIETIKADVDKLLAAMETKDLKWTGDLQRSAVGGVQVLGRRGTGTKDGKPYELATIVGLNGTNALVIVLIVQHDRAAAYKDVLAATIASLAKTK